MGEDKLLDEEGSLSKEVREQAGWYSLI